MIDKFSWTKGDVVKLSDCLMCKHFHKDVIDKNECDAFDNIPGELIVGNKHHDQPIEGDNGIQFEKIIVVKEGQ
jgi:hypothetical protein